VTRKGVTGAFVVLGAAGCSQVTTPMRSGVPLEVNRGYCFMPTEFKQRGEPVNRENTMKWLAHYKPSSPYVNAGNVLAVGSIGATVVATSAFGAAAMGSTDSFKMSDGAKNALIGTAIGVGILSVILCVSSDGKYATAAEVYNAHLRTPDNLPPDDSAPVAAKPSAADPSVVREPGDDGNYTSPDAPTEKPPPAATPEDSGMPYTGGTRP
jgi:hypothetical protein